jgi:hypothetical protein
MRLAFIDLNDAINVRIKAGFAEKRRANCEKISATAYTLPGITSQV